MPISGSLIPFLVLLKSVLIFHRWGFYGTDSIHEKSDGQSYFSNTKMFVNVQIERDLWAEITLWTKRVFAILNHADRRKMNDGTLRRFHLCEIILSSCNFTFD